jgi:hypothetical protein
LECFAIATVSAMLEKLPHPSQACGLGVWFGGGTLDVGSA